MFKRLFGSKPSFPSEVTWLSHHIPKTAGTSLRVAYENAVGKRNVFKLYKPVEVTRFEQGEICLPKHRPFIIHGHYKPDFRQLAIGGDVKRLVWLRDPVQRAWSLLRHLTDVQQHKPEFELLTAQFGKKATAPDEEVLEFFLANREFAHLNRPYQNYFKNVGLESFDFIGCMENFDADLARLSGQMQVKLSIAKSNVRHSKVSIDTSDFKHYLAKEYKVIEKFTNY